MWAEVGRHGEGPSVERGPLEAYKAVWPERYLKWDPKRGLWCIRAKEPDTGQDVKIEFVFWWDVKPGEVRDAIMALPASMREAVLQRHVERGSPIMMKIYRPFDWGFVRQRLRERQEFLRLGVEAYTHKIADHNIEVGMKRLRSAFSELNYFFEHDKRFLPELVGEDREVLGAGADFKENT